MDLGYPKDFRVAHGDNRFSNGRLHLSRIESFWSFAKRRLQKFNGIDSSSFDLHLKESEFRFNNRNKNIFELLLNIFKNNPLN